MAAKIRIGIFLTLALTLALPAQTAQELYQRGLVQEHANGNLDEAIGLYSQALKAAGKDRALAAKALLRIAGSREKLGRQAEASSAYAEVVRSYPEQRTEVSAAQERLNQLRKAPPASASRSAAPAAADVSAVTGPLFESYCSSCHDGAARAGGLDLGALNAKAVSEQTAMWETVLRRLRARRDPPANAPRPDEKTYRAVISRLEQALDGAYSANNPLKLGERVTETEWAERIALLIWDAEPDVSLLDDARSGRLRDSAVLNRQVVRMLRDPRSSSFAAGFLEPWLLPAPFNRAPLDVAGIPQADPELVHAMQTESRLFLQSQIREDRGATELWTANYTYLNDRLARLYGVAGVFGKDFRRTAWPDSNRAGLLALSGPLAALSTSSRTSPTRRGIFVLTRFLGMDPPDPPASVPPLAETAAAQERSMRERMIAHKAVPSCATCHSSFDPLGLALENLDPLGQWRTTDGEAPIDASGAFIDGTRFNGPAELRSGLMKYADAYYANTARHLLAYALHRKGSRGGRLYDYEMPSARAIVRSAASRDYRWSALISGVISSAPFQMKTVVP